MSSKRGGRIVSRGRGGRGRGGGRETRRHVNIRSGGGDAMGDDGNYPRICISNLPRTVDKSDLMEFLKSKSYQPNLNFKGFEFKNTKLYLAVEGSDNIPALVSLTGIRYGGVKLVVSQEDSNSANTRVVFNGKGQIPFKDSQNKLSATRQLKHIEEHITNTYANNPIKEVIDFSYLHSTKELDFNDNKTLRQVFRLISEKCEKAITVSFSHNNINTLASFKLMIKYSLDHVINFNFDSNKITDINELDNLTDLSLRELVFTNNPIAQLPNYRMEVARKFPDLLILDGVPIGPEDFPPSPIPPLRPNYCDSQERQQFAFRFLEKYFTTFDKSREEIIKAYTEESKFSMTFMADSSTLPMRGSTKTYQRNNRNLKKPSDDVKKTQLLFSGYDNIYNFFKVYPVTSHYLASSVIDTFLAPGSSLLNVVIHGHYLETTFSSKRSYDRTFILAPSQPGSEAAKGGWEAIILNEQLHVRPYVRLPRLEPVTQPIANITAPVGAEMESLINDFAVYTKLKPEFAKECLTLSGWDKSKALETFQNLKANNQIPADYFVA
ncbi:hypothetical protein ACTA71_012179 [Dictyostelium dimigraforme]